MINVAKLSPEDYLDNLLDSYLTPKLRKTHAKNFKFDRNQAEMVEAIYVKKIVILGRRQLTLQRAIIENF